jgi:hypothetical protein
MSLNSEAFFIMTGLLRDSLGSNPDKEDTPFYGRFEIFMVVTMKNAVFWDVTPCGACKNRRFGVT